MTPEHHIADLERDLALYHEVTTEEARLILLDMMEGDIVAARRTTLHMVDQLTNP